MIWDEAEELPRLAELSKPKVPIEPSGLSLEATEFLIPLTRDIGRLSLKDRGAPTAELIKRVKECPLATLCQSAPAKLWGTHERRGFSRASSG